jgi:glycosyltransferase involved in cell wall biosynthesis
MAKAPTVSVVMPAYNTAKYLKNAIESVLQQTFADFEFIIVDDCSTDGTGAIADEYAKGDSRVVVLHNEKNIGVTRSRNRGLDAAKGEFIAKMDADDMSYPQRFEKQVAYLRSNPNICMVSTSYERIDETGAVIGPIVLNFGKDELRKMMIAENYVCHGTVMYRREPVMRLGKYREKILISEDYDLWLRMIEKYEIAQIPDILYKFRISEGSLSSKHASEMTEYNRLVKQFARERELCGKDSYDSILENPVLAGTTSQDGITRSVHLRIGLAFLASDKKREARGEFWECIKTKPFHGWYWLLIIASLIPTAALNILRRIWRKAPREIH